jgi:hypothetical protein
MNKSLIKRAIGAAALLATASVFAQSLPTSAALEATAGSLAVGTAKIATPNGFGSGTVYYPKSGTNYGLIVIAPGFTEGESFNAFWGAKLASWGYVAVNIGTKTVLDLPGPRADQMWAALQQVIALSKTSGSPFAGKVDGSRLGAMGHSMGGGGTLLVTQAHPEIKAGIPMAPWNLTQKNFPKITVPTMMFACQNDIIAPVSGHVDRFWTSFNTSLPRVLAESKGQDHFCPTNLTSAAEKAAFGKIAIAWYKMWIDGKTEYKQFVQTNNSPVFSRYVAAGL